jgi:subtilisin family serine protease
MNKKKLPVKIFEKRLQVDERVTEGGGNQNTPKWVLKGEELEERAIILSEDIQSASSIIKDKLKKFSGTPAVIKAQISDDIIAKSHRSDISEFFSPKKQKDKLLGLSKDQELLFRIDAADHVDYIENNINNYRRNEKVISGVNSIKAFDTQIDLDEIGPTKDGKYILKVRLMDFNDYQINDHSYHVFKKIIDADDNLLLQKSIRYNEKLTIHQVVADSLDNLEQFADFSGVMSIEPMPVIVVEDSFFAEPPLDLPQPKDDNDYPKVGVLDSGIANSHPIKDWTLIERHTNYPPHLIKFGHGTFVAGVINFGDELEESDFTGGSKFKIFDAAVYPNSSLETITEADLVDNIREAIEKNPEIKIWNLSLGSSLEIDDNAFSDFAVGLDSIQDENDVLIIKSASNCRNFVSEQPISRIAIGADSVRSLTVGSIAHEKGEYDIADINHRSPFSRVGPGPAHIIKPELVHYGGNAGLKDGQLQQTGVKSLNDNGGLTTAIGTSFSTPRVTAIAADLNHKLREEFDPVLLKSLLLHSARYPSEVDLPINEKINQLGFGVPDKADKILFNDEHEITLILRDTLNKGEFTEILDFPFPESLIDENGYFYGQVVLTLVNTPLLADGQGPEYCQSNIDVLFGTYDEKTPRDISKRTVINPIGKSNMVNLLLSSNYSRKKAAPTDSFSRSEKVSIQYGDKFYPVKKYAVDFSQLTKANKDKALKHPKNWFLKVDGLYREYIETQSEINRSGLSQDYCLIITIRDPQRKHHVYDEVNQLLDRHNFISRDIQLSINQNINIDNDSVDN